MDLRVLVLSADHALAELVRAQVENLGNRCSMAETYRDAGPALSWAEAAIVDLASADGIDDLHRLRVELPKARILAIAPDESQADAARDAGAHQVLLEPFSVADIVGAVRMLYRASDAEVVDLRTGERTAAPVVDDAPWWATR